MTPPRPLSGTPGSISIALDLHEGDRTDYRIQRGLNKLLYDELAAEQVRWIRDNGWAGLYLMSPSAHQPVLEVLRRGLG